MKPAQKVIYPFVCLVISCGFLSTSVTASQHGRFFQTPYSAFFDQIRMGFGFSGEYINAEAKISVQPSSTLINGNPANLVPPINFSAQQTHTGKYFPLTPCIEIGNTFGNSYYLGIFASWHYSNLKNRAQSSIQEDYFQHEFKLKHYTDILLKIGYKLSSKMMTYGLIGPTLTRWSHKSTQIGGNGRVNNVFSTHKLSTGLGIGGGIEYFINKNYAFSIDYIHHFQRPTSKIHLMTYEAVDGADRDIRRGDLNRRVNLSYATIAFRFTAFFQL